MILADSSIWVDHLRAVDPHLKHHLLSNNVLMHPFILGEIMLGNLSNRTRALSMLQELQPAVVADDDDVTGYIERHALYGRGIGYIDVHLLASVRLTQGASLWTRDNRLLAVAERLNLAYRLN